MDIGDSYEAAVSCLGQWKEFHGDVNVSGKEFCNRSGNDFYLSTIVDWSANMCYHSDGGGAAGSQSLCITADTTTYRQLKQPMGGLLPFAARKGGVAGVLR